MSAHATADGRVRQDSGAPDADRQISLRTDWMSETTLDAFRAKLAQVGIQQGTGVSGSLPLAQP